MLSELILPWLPKLDYVDILTKLIYDLGFSLLWIERYEPRLKSKACRGILSKILDSDALRDLASSVGAKHLSDNELRDVFNRIQECFAEINNTFAAPPKDLRKAYAVVVAAVALLSYVYLYLTGCGGWDGSTADSSGSLDYRDTYISIVLFQGSYVWIKFRDVAVPKPLPGGAVRKVGKGDTVKYEPRFKPHKENGLPFNWIYLGRYGTRADAEVVYRIAASCYEYGKCYGTPLDLGDGELFTIIPEFTAEEQTLSGTEKVPMVKEKAKTGYECYKTQKDARNLSPTLPGASLEQEIENRHLQSEVVSLHRRCDDLARQLQSQEQTSQLQIEDLQRQIQDLQEAQELQVPNLQPQFQDLQQRGAESLSTHEYPQQSQQGLQEAQQLQVRNIQPQLQLPYLEKQQRGAESLSTVEYPQQSQQGLQGVQQFQVPNFQPQFPLQDLQHQLLGESSSFDEFLSTWGAMAPFLEEAGHWHIQPVDGTTMWLPGDFGDSVHT